MRNEILAALLDYEKSASKKVFLSKGNTQISYSAFLKLVRKQIAIIQKHKSMSGFRAGILIENSPEAFISIFSVLLAGGTYVPLSPNDPNNRIKKIISDSAITHLFCSNREQWELKNLEIPKEIEVLYLEDIFKNDIAETKFNFTPMLENRPCYIMYTSGSTGAPKGVVINDSQVKTFVNACLDIFDFSEDESFASLTRLNFDLSIYNIFLTFFIGAKVVFPESELDYSYPSRLLLEHNVTNVLLVPQITNLLDSIGALDSEKFENLKNVLFCGDVLTLNHINLWRKNNAHVNYFNTYGPTETTVFVTSYKVPQNEIHYLIPIGQALPNSHTDLDDDFQIIISGDQVSEDGYLNLSSENFYHLNNTRFYRSGDIAGIDSSGVLHFKGRMNDQIKINGYRLELGEVEAVLNGHELVKDCVCLANKSRSAIFAAIKLKTETSRSVSELVAELLEFARKNLSPYAVPLKIILIDKFELNSNGKIDKEKLLTLF